MQNMICFFIIHIHIRIHVLFKIVYFNNIGRDSITISSKCGSLTWKTETRWTEPQYAFLNHVIYIEHQQCKKKNPSVRYYTSIEAAMFIWFVLKMFSSNFKQRNNRISEKWRIFWNFCHIQFLLINIIIVIFLGIVDNFKQFIRYFNVLIVHKIDLWLFIIIQKIHCVTWTYSFQLSSFGWSTNTVTLFHLISPEKKNGNKYQVNTLLEFWDKFFLNKKNRKMPTSRNA